MHHGGSLPTDSNKMPTYISKLVYVMHVAVVIVALSIAFFIFDATLFSWHPVMMSIGYIIFMAEGLVASVMFRHLEGMERVRAIQSHALMQLRALLCVAVGFGVIYRNKILGGKLHFQSLHAKVGLATLILTFLSPLLGLVSFKRLGVLARFSERWQRLIKAMHRQLGRLTWLLSLVAIGLALRHPAVDKGALSIAWQVGVAFVGVLMLVIMAKAQAPKQRDTQDGFKAV